MDVGTNWKTDLGTVPPCVPCEMRRSTIICIFLHGCYYCILYCIDVLLSGFKCVTVFFLSLRNGVSEWMSWAAPAPCTHPLWAQVLSLLTINKNGCKANNYNNNSSRRLSVCSGARRCLSGLVGKLNGVCVFQSSTGLRSGSMVVSWERRPTKWSYSKDK